MSKPTVSKHWRKPLGPRRSGLNPTRTTPPIKWQPDEILHSKSCNNQLHLLLRPGRGAEYCDQPVCLNMSTSLEPLDRSAWNFVCRSPLAVARSSSGSVALRYVLPVFWMMSRLAIMGVTLKWGGCTVQRWMTRWYQGGVWCLWMLVIFCIFPFAYNSIYYMPKVQCDRT